METPVLNDLALIGVNYNNANVAVRERLSITHDETTGFLTTLRNSDLARESLVLSTCNRTELYCLSNRPDLVLGELIARGGRHLEDLRDLFYVKQGREMIQHAFAVASGLDSMILGEPEILGQMKKAFIAAREGNFAGTTLSQLFERSFNVAKKVRTSTAVSRETVSAPAICAKLAERIYGELDQCSALCVGAGTIIESTLNHFAANGVGNLTIANRTLSHARDLAANFGAQTLAYEDVTQQLHQYDIIITATSSVLPVIGKGALERAIRKRKRKPIAIFDLAVPRDVEPEASEIEDIFLHTIDNIGDIAGANLAKRREAAEQARDHIEAATEDLVEWFARRDAVDVIKDLRLRLDTLRDTELERSIAALQNGADAEQVISKLAKRLTSRLAHEPLQSLRDNHANRDLVEELSNWYRDDRTNNDKDKPEA